MHKLQEIFKRVVQDVKDYRYALIVLAVYAIITQSMFGTVCPWRIVTHMPCPACGLTRAGINVLLGRWKRAWDYNPTIFLWIVLILWWAALRYVWTEKNGSKLFTGAAIVCVCITIVCYSYRILV